MSTITEPRNVPPASPHADRRAGPFVTAYSISREKMLYGGLLLLTAIAYLWGLSKNGYANEYYAAAVQAGSTSWKAWFFGAFDSSSFITVDKTPASLWVMGLSGRIFGFGVWSMLIPQALMGVASVAFLYVSVRRWFSANAALLAGAILALTPVAVLMFRFNNPDALLILLLVAGALAVTRAIDSERHAARWMALAGVLVGFGFLTKMLQAFLVLPAFGLAYLIAGKPALGKRLLHSLGALAALVVSAGWWIAIVELMPASARPYIGGSTTNSILELTLGYNGLGRLTGNETGSVGGGVGNPGWGGATGLQRLFGGEFASQIAWLLPTALLATIVLVVAAGRAGRTDKTRAFAILWGGWLVVTGLVFSYMQGIIHSYYMIALAPAIGALIGAAAMVLWRRRAEWVARAALAGGALLTAGWSFSLLQATPTWMPWLRWTILIAGVAAAGLVLILPELELRRTTVRRAGLFAATLLALTALAGPAAYSIQTISTAHAGALPSAGPASAGSRMGGGGGPMGAPPGQGGTGTTNGQGGTGTTNGQGAPGTTNGQGGTTGQGGTGTTGRGQGGAGGFLGGGGISGVSSELVTLLQQGAKGYTWAAAAVTANGAAPVQIAAEVPVMAIGGFNGTDAAPTLAQFQELVAQGKIHYFIGSGGGGFGGGRGGTSSEISTWVAENFQAQTVGSTTIYDLTTTN
ncbi:4-amino-4-deoxy-L-arabinose transferase-like glycosyltransferase [Kribbella orskensis]|uniref:4-amino-4-deoxy-L-arabinose transferase-like glycosyltransferase n=1 Tax=Kribbella orskensis TaxID=2512216 RepID=A0ABY2BF29_9ACTN|nr:MULTISPECIES: glycosyltransferase family 39 protein [Kribbella]TCN36939.1 4-amino-4-deoxy-L-arabinose transferase-like glycosyltransferase [Kribbella sp. VKM Ac-2500]TCO18364.1 4-amino-4-deoxy-L-arabinose transferase-like glycosyltransferase [Kribbella orskensis]